MRRRNRDGSGLSRSAMQQLQQERHCALTLEVNKEVSAASKAEAGAPMVCSDCDKSAADTATGLCFRPIPAANDFEHALFLKTL